MTQIQIVRVIAQDMPQYTTEEVEYLGTSLTIQTEINPVVAGSVIITGQEVLPASTVDTDTGVITFASLPNAQTLTIGYKWVLLSDASIQALIDLNTPDDGGTLYLKLVAADVLDSIASSQSLVYKKTKVLDVQTDGPAVAADLRKHAKELRDQVYNSLSGDFAGDDFDIVEQINDTQGWWEFVAKDIERSEL